MKGDEIMRYFNEIPDLENYDIVVGIPSYNNATTISHVASVAAKGIREMGLKGLIANSDGGSTDGTQQVFMETNTEGVDKITLRYNGIPGKGSAIRLLFEITHKSQAKVFIMLDSDLRSVEPWWIERLAQPIISNKTHYVTPLYLRHKYDGTITNNICYPLTSSLYGIKIRQPIGGDFGVSGELINIYLSKPEKTWETHVARFGIDIWMTTIAINESGKKPVQAALGAKVHDVKDPGKHLQGMFIQVVQTLFDLMIEYEHIWKNVRNIENVEVYGSQPSQVVEEIKVDLENLKRRAIETVSERKDRIGYLNQEIVSKVLSKGTIDIDDWIEIVYTVANKYKKEKSEDTVVDLLGFYFARVADFVEKTRDIDTVTAERILEDQLARFFEKKEEFAKKW